MSRTSEILTLEVRDACENPVYLRWKTTLHGWAYYLFSFRQIKDVSVDSSDLYRENFTALASQQVVNNFYKKDSREVWQLFAENIVTSDIQLLQTITDSPRVDRYLGSDKWQSVLLTDFNLSDDTYKKRGDVSLSIQLPEKFTLSN
jgi:hypothetical protein